MEIDPADFVDVQEIGDVTLIKFLEAKKYHFNPTQETKTQTETNLELLRAKFKGDALPPLPGPGKRPFPNQHEQVRDYLISLIDENQPLKIVLDFAGLERIGDIPLFAHQIFDMYVRPKRQSDAYGGNWRICGITEERRQFYRISSLRHIFPDIHENQEDAIAAFNTASRGKTT